MWLDVNFDDNMDHSDDDVGNNDISDELMKVCLLQNH